METFGAAHNSYLNPPENFQCEKCECADKYRIFLKCWNAGVCTCHPGTARIVTAARQPS